MERKILTIEEAVEKIGRIVDRVEDGFYREHSRYPSLVDEEDYILLGDHINMSEEYHNSNGGIAPHDIAHEMIKRFLERKGFFDFAGDERKTAINGLLGRVNYRPHPREYQFRFLNTKSLLNKGVPFPDNTLEIADTIKKIGKICFLNSVKDREKFKKGYERVGTEFVNPTWIAHLFRDWTNYQDVLREWSGWDWSKEFNPENHFYK